MNDKLKNTSASLAAAFCSPFLEADVEIDKDGFQRTDVIWCCDADGKSFPKPPSWARPDFDPTPGKTPLAKPTQTPTPSNTTQTPMPTNTANQQPSTNTATPTPPKNVSTNPPPVSVNPLNPPQTLPPK